VTRAHPLEVHVLQPVVVGVSGASLDIAIDIGVISTLDLAQVLSRDES